MKNLNFEDRLYLDVGDIVVDPKTGKRLIVTAEPDGETTCSGCFYRNPNATIGLEGDEFHQHCLLDEEDRTNTIGACDADLRVTTTDSITPPGVVFREVPRRSNCNPGGEL